MIRLRNIGLSAAALMTALLAFETRATPVFHGPTPYTSAANIPAGFYAGVPTALETFEDGTLGFGITANGILRVPSAFTDSVDGDDGIINGLGQAGHSWLTTGTSITFTFSAPVTAAGLVVTDSVGTIRFEAFGPGMVLLGATPNYNLADASFSGTTAEDRFLGVRDTGGIIAIRVVGSVAGIEVDHVQYGNAAGGTPAPEPAALVLLGLALGATALRRRQPAQLAGSNPRGT